MKYPLIQVCVLSAVMVSCSPPSGDQTTGLEPNAVPPRPVTPAAQPEVVDFLASRDLEDWNYILQDPAVKKEDVWSFNEAGHLICLGEPLGFLATRQSFSRFKLTVEWRWPGEPGNSGVLMFIQSDDPIPTSVEAQLKHGSAGNLMGLRGAVIDGEGLVEKEHPTIGALRILAKKAGEEKPAGEWNRYVITVENDSIKLLLNGELANECTLPETLSGPIGFQSEGRAIEFRMIQLTPLD